MIIIFQKFRGSNCHIITPKLCAHGKPQPYKLLQEDLSLLQKSDISLPPETHSLVTMCKGVHLLTSGRTITATAKTKSHLRDNSGIMYTDSAGDTRHGQLEKVLLIECAEKVFSYAVISEYTPTSKGLCKDTTTNARINDHIIVLNIPRLDKLH